MLAVVQLDAVSVPLLERMLDEGRLPVLDDLRRRGTWTPLESTAQYFPAASYATLYSGLEVGHHTQYYAFQWSPREQRLRFRTHFGAPETLWARLSRAGRRSLVVDAYESELPQQLNGVAVGGWQFRNVLSLERTSTPAGVGRELAARFGRPPLLQEVFGRPSPAMLLRTRATLLAGPRRVADAALDLLARGDYDHVWLTFLGGHLGGHLFWDLSSVDGVRLDPETRSLFATALPELYEAMDRELGRIVEALPADVDLLLVSPLGMGPNTARVDMVADMLAAVLGRNGSAGRPAGGFVWRLRDAVPTRARQAVAAAIGGALTRQLTARISTLRIDWSETPAFLLPSDHNGQLRLNVRGRERDGIVDAAGAKALAEEIGAGLATFTDPDDSPSVAAVERTAELLGEVPFLELLPDLVVRFPDRPTADIHTVRSERFGEVERRGGGTGRSGSHTPDAWVLLVPSRSRLREPSRPARVTDVAATVCAVAGADAGGLHGESLLR